MSYRDLPDLRSGVWKHYKGGLYEVIGYSQNTSDGNREQVAYVPLYTDPEKIGPRIQTRDVEEWFEYVCTMHDGMEWHSDEHAARTVEHRNSPAGINESKHQNESSQPRFRYMGPVYYKGMES